jgi:hypothetical protein
LENTGRILAEEVEEAAGATRAEMVVETETVITEIIGNLEKRDIKIASMN